MLSDAEAALVAIALALYLKRKRSPLDQSGTDEGHRTLAL
jgi:hypothetical protein